MIKDTGTPGLGGCEEDYCNGGWVAQSRDMRARVMALKMYSPTGVVRPRSWKDIEALKRVDFWSREEMMVSELTHERS